MFLIYPQISLIVSGFQHGIQVIHVFLLNCYKHNLLYTGLMFMSENITTGKEHDRLIDIFQEFV